MKNIFLLVCCFYFLQNLAQDKYSINFSKKFSIDTNYVKDVSDRLIIKTLFDKNENAVFFYDKSNNELALLPNRPARLAFVFDYKWIGFTVALPQKYSPLKVDTSLKGETKELYLGFDFFFNKWMQTVTYEKTKGFYVANTGDLIDDWVEGIDPYLQSDLSIEKIGGTTSYIFNSDRFSYRSFLWQTQIQKISAGSLISSFSYYYTLKHNNLESPDTYYKKAVLLNLQTGYQYNWVILKLLMLSSGVYGGLGVTGSKSYENGIAKDLNKPYYSLNMSLKMNINLMYQYKSFFCGGKFNTHSFAEKNGPDSSSTHSHNYGAFFLGYRFNAPEVVKKPAEWTEKKMSLK